MWVPQRSSAYHPTQLILALRRLNKTDILQSNRTFLERLGLTRFPDKSTLRRFLKRPPTKTIRRVARLPDSLRAYLFALPKSRTTLVFDLDTVVLVICGHPEKPGRRSYHPLLCFKSHFQQFWHGSLRPGNAGAATGAVPLLRVCQRRGFGWKRCGQD